MSEVYIYILVMALTSFAIRVLPLTLIQTEIKNPLIKSFLYYVPYITLAVMTFPAIIQVTQTPLSGAIALVIGIVLSWFGANLFQVASSCCLSAGIGSLNKILNNLSRTDLLDFGDGRKIKKMQVARWDAIANSVDYRSLVPRI